MCLDGSSLVHEGLEIAFRNAPGFKWLGCTDDQARIVELVREKRVDVLLLDAEAKSIDCGEVVRRLACGAPGVRPVVLSARLERACIDAALTCGAWGFIDKGDSHEIIPLVRRVVGGEVGLSQAVLAVLK
jgi:DNA-binding NarL/FixJ family response regulator